MDTILAVAVGSQANSHTFTSMDDAVLNTVRPYVKGLVYKLFTKGKIIGTHYIIKYEEVVDPTAFFSGLAGAPELIFCMSRTVLQAASTKYPQNTGVPIVGIVSNPSDFNNNNKVFGISGQRAQKGRQYYDKFVDTVPILKTAGQKLFVLTKKNYKPTDEAFSDLPNFPNPAIVRVNVSSFGEIAAGIPADTPGGILVLPADLFFADAPKIIKLADDRKLPDFWPVTDWVKPALPSALAGYGVPQLMCGEMLGDRIADYWAQGGVPNPPFKVVNDSDFVWMASVSASIARKVAIDNPSGLIHV
jgi:hypothetical protein